MRKVFWLLTLAATVLGGIYLLYTLATALNNTQEAAGIALSLAIVIIPYVFTRCLEGMRHNDVMRVRIVGPERPAPQPERRVEEPTLAPEPAAR